MRRRCTWLGASQAAFLCQEEETGIPLEELFLNFRLQHLNTLEKTAAELWFSYLARAGGWVLWNYCWRGTYMYWMHEGCIWYLSDTYLIPMWVEVLQPACCCSLVADSVCRNLIILIAIWDVWGLRLSSLLATLREQKVSLHWTCQKQAASNGSTHKRSSTRMHKFNLPLVFTLRACWLSVLYVLFSTLC